MTELTPPAGSPWQLAFVALGANLGDAVATLRQALADLSRLPETRMVAHSSMYRTAPHQAQGPDFFNAVAALHTGLSPQEFLTRLLALELAHGRERPYHHAPRTLDLDLLLLGDQQVQTPTLSLPHPRLHQRAFVLHPLAELAPNLLLPHLGVTVASLLPDVADQSLVRLETQA